LTESLSLHRNPLIVDPEGHVNADDRARIISDFEFVRGTNLENGPPMYIVSPSDRGEDMWKPTFTPQKPEKVILSRLCALAKRSHQHLMVHTVSSDESNDDKIWVGIFKENPNSLKSYSALLRVNPSLIVDGHCSSTGFDLTTTKTSFELSMQKRSLGPKDLRKRVFKNLNGPKAANSVVVSWSPVDLLVAQLRLKFGHIAVFFYNEFTPDVIAVLWRPNTFSSQPFTAMHSEFKRPIDDNWQVDSLIKTNPFDVLQEMQFLARDMIIDMKILDNSALSKNETPMDTLGGTKRKPSSNSNKVERSVKIKRANR